MRNFIFISLIFLGCSYSESEAQVQKTPKIDEKKLLEFIKKNFSKYQLFEKPIIKAQYKNIILVDFASAGATTNYSAVLLYKNNNFKLLKLKNGNEVKDAIFVIGAGGAGRYMENVKLDEKLKVYSYSLYEEDNDYCKVLVYDFVKEIFVLNENLSNDETKSYCQKVCKDLGVESKACKDDTPKKSEF